MQLPIFIVLYYTIKELERLESFRTGGLFWFRDLTAADSFFVLPVLYVATMMAAQEVTIRRTNLQQKVIMRMMPLVFGFFLASSGFPLGLFVYWVTSNTITLCQNLILYRKTSPAPPEAKPEPEARSLKSPPAPPAEKNAAPPSPNRRKRGKRKSRKS